MNLQGSECADESVYLRFPDMKAVYTRVDTRCADLSPQVNHYK